MTTTMTMSRGCRNTLCFYSSVTPYLKHQALKKLLVLAVPGALLLLSSALTVESPSLGFMIFSLSLLMITWGLMPYRKILHLERIPHKLEITQENLTFHMKQKSVFRIPLEEIKEVSFRENLKLYGICLTLKNLEDLPGEYTRWHLQSKRLGCDLFLPYFRERHSVELKACLN
jgi:hypothetical protein